MAESKEELKRLLVREKKESERASLKLNIKKTKIMASGPSTSWQIQGEKVETVADFIFFGSSAEAPICWPPDVRSRLTGKDPDTGKD